MLCLKCQLIVEGNWCLAPGWRCEQLLGKASFQVLSIFWWPSRTCKSRQRMLTLMSVPGTSTSSTASWLEPFCLIPRPLAMESNLVIFSLFDFIVEADFERWTFSPNFDNSTDALFKKLFRFADLWRRTIESNYPILTWTSLSWACPEHLHLRLRRDLNRFVWFLDRWHVVAPSSQYIEVEVCCIFLVLNLACRLL